MGAFLTDLHTHLLPSVDDGARTFREAARHLEDAHRDGVREVVLTPHLDASTLTARRMEALVELHRSVLADLRDWCRDLGGVPALTLGHELLARCGNDAERALDVEGTGLGSSSWVLVEFGFDVPGRPIEVIRTLREGGRNVLVAHAERYAFGDGGDPLAVLRSWKGEGAALQVDGGSLEGHYGARPHRLAVALLAHRMVDVIASDHHGDFRPHRLVSAARYTAFRATPDEAFRLTGGNPQRILQDTPLRRPPDPPALPWTDGPLRPGAGAPA